MFFVGEFSSEYLPMGVFVEDVDKLFDSFNSVKRAAPLHSPLSDDSPHIDHWTKASMGNFLEDDKPTFKKQTPSHNGWIRDIGAVQLVWRLLKSAGFDYLETRSLNQDPLENTFGVIFFFFLRCVIPVVFVQMTRIWCIISSGEHNYISRSSTVGIQLHVSALYVGQWPLYKNVGCFLGIGVWAVGRGERDLVDPIVGTMTWGY